MPKTTKKTTTYSIPMLPLRGLVVYPHMILHFDVGRVKSIKAIEEAMLKDQNIFLTAQKDLISRTLNLMRFIIRHCSSN